MNTSITRLRRFLRRGVGGFTACSCRIRFCGRCTTKTLRGYCGLGEMRLLGMLMLALPLSAASVRVWEGTLPLATTVEGAPDPNPPFDIFSTTKFNYPYTLRE